MEDQAFLWSPLTWGRRFVTTNSNGSPCLSLSLLWNFTGEIYLPVCGWWGGGRLQLFCFASWVVIVWDVCMPL
jgi:hypothetical protein